MMIVVYIVEGLALFFLILGIIFVIAGKLSFKCTAATEGRIIDMCFNAYDYNNGHSGSTAFGIRVGSLEPGMYCPVFTYCVNGMEYTRASNVSWNRDQIKRKINKPRTIYYNPENPKQASLTKRSFLDIMGKIFILVGAVSLAAGIIFWICLI